MSFKALKGAILDKATLGDVVLFCILEQAKLRGARIFLCDLTRAGLHGTIFDDAKLTDVDFQSASLKDVSFIGSTLIRSNFRHVKNLEIEQLCSTITFVGSEFDIEMRKLIEERCPEKLEFPPDFFKNIQKVEDIP